MKLLPGSLVTQCSLGPLVDAEREIQGGADRWMSSQATRAVSVLLSTCCPSHGGFTPGS